MTNRSPKSWKKFKLKECAYVNPENITNAFPHTTIKYIDINSVGSGVLNHTTEFKLSEAPSRARRIASDYDIILSTVRPNRRSFYYFENVDSNFVISTGFAVIRAKINIAEPKYLYYFITHPYTTRYLTLLAKGTAYPAVDSDIVENIEIALPVLKIQRKISSFLYNFDKLIEINRKKIEILEEMAQILYREWFVEFRFPGHEKVKMVDPELGKIPQGWDFEKIESVVEHHIGGGWGEDENSNENSEAGYVIRGTDIEPARKGNFSNCPLRHHKKSTLNSRLLQKGNIVFEASGGSEGQLLGRTLFISKEVVERFNKPIICASFCKLIRLKQKIKPELFYLLLNWKYITGDIGRYQVQSTGISNFHFKTFIKMEYILVPPVDLQKKFHNITYPILEQIQKLGTINYNLVKTRDLLLPKLMSGEIDVTKLDIKTN